VLNTLQVVETACCKSIAFSNAPAYVYADFTKYPEGTDPSAWEFTFKLSAAGKNSLTVTYLLRTKAGEAVSESTLSVTPASSTLAAGQRQTTFYLYGSEFLSGDFIIDFALSGPSADEYDAMSSLPVEVISTAQPKPAPSLYEVRLSNEGSFVYITFDSPTDYADITRSNWNCSELFEFDSASYSTCNWINNTFVEGLIGDSDDGTGRRMLGDMMEFDSFSGSEFYGAEAEDVLHFREPESEAEEAFLLSQHVNSSNVNTTLSQSAMPFEEQRQRRRRLTKISSNSYFALKEGKLKAACSSVEECATFATNTFKESLVKKPRKPVAPRPSLSMPSKISSCDDLTVDPTQSAGFGGRPLKSVTWQVSAYNGNNGPIQAFLNLYPSVAAPIVIKNRDIGPTTYAITLCLTNFLDRKACVTVEVAVSSNKNLPKYQIKGSDAVSIAWQTFVLTWAVCLFSLLHSF
jgi:hypothetical protein